jgi:hypothetical protein
MSIEKYPYYKLKTPSDKESLIKNIRKMAVYWEKLTTRSQDMSLGRLKSETISELKKHFKWYVSSEAAKIWLGWKSKGKDSKKRSTKRISKKRSTKKISKKRSNKRISKKIPKKRSNKRISKKIPKKRSNKRISKKRSTKRISKKRSMKKSTIRKRHSNTSPSRERIRANRPSPSTGASSQKIGTIMKGNDGKMYKVIKTSSGTRRWVKN